MLHRFLAHCLVTGTCALTLLLAGCDGDDSAAPAAVTATPFVSVVQSNAVGAAGGSVSLTAADGTQYTLEVPAGALARNTTLSLTTAEPEGVQRFRLITGPDGLVFKVGRPATLTIKLPAGRALPAGGALTYNGAPVPITRNPDGTLVLTLMQLRGTAAVTGLAGRATPAAVFAGSVLVCRDPSVSASATVGVASIDRVDLARYADCVTGQIEDLRAVGDFNTAARLAMSMDELFQNSNMDNTPFLTAAKTTACAARQGALDALAVVVIAAPEDILLIEKLAYWDMVVQKLGGATCAGQAELTAAVQPKIDDALTLIEDQLPALSNVSVTSVEYTRLSTTARNTVDLRDKLLAMAQALGTPVARSQPVEYRAPLAAAGSPYRGATVATNNLQGQIEPAMLTDLLPAPWNVCRTAGDYVPLMALMDQFSSPDSVKSAAQYCATRFGVEVLDNRNQPTGSLSGFGGVAAGHNQTSGSVGATVDGVLRLTGPIGALRCPAGVAGSEELVVRFAGVEVRRLSAAPYLAISLSLNISDLRAAAGLASSNTAPQLLTIERTGAACAGYWGPAPAPLITVTIVFAGTPKLKIAAGGAHTCALLSGGTISCWGSNVYGQLGNGSTTDALTPGPVSGITTATAISVGYYHTCAILSGGTVSCWGDNTYGQLGTGTVTTATAIAVGGFHTCALLSSGTVSCWGRNDHGQLGGGTVTAATAISAGGYHTCALLSGGTVSCWGLNDYGQLGNGTVATATAISAGGGGHTCALLTGGTVSCWGRNGTGQLGNGTTTNSSTPVTVSGLLVP